MLCSPMTWVVGLGDKDNFGATDEQRRTVRSAHGTGLGCAVSTPGLISHLNTLKTVVSTVISVMVAACGKKMAMVESVRSTGSVCVQSMEAILMHMYSQIKPVLP